MRSKFKWLRRKTKGARDWFGRVRPANSTLFAHWQLCHGNGRNIGSRVSERFTHGCVSSEGWHVQQGQTCRGKSQSPVVWIAEVMETETLKPIDKVSLGEIYQSPGRNKSERIVASKVKATKGRASYWKAKAA